MNIQHDFLKCCETNWFFHNLW